MKAKQATIQCYNPRTKRLEFIGVLEQITFNSPKVVNVTNMGDTLPSYVPVGPGSITFQMFPVFDFKPKSTTTIQEILDELHRRL